MADYVLSVSASNDFFPSLYSSVYFQIRGEKSWNWWLWSGIQEGDLWRKEPGGGAVDRRRKKRRKGRVWVTPLCGSFCCPFLSPTKAWQHKLKVTVDISKSTLKLTNLPLMFQLFIVFMYPGNIIKFFFFTIFFTLSLIYSFIRNVSECSFNSESKPYVWFPAMCTDLWITWLGCAGQRKGRCSVNTVCASPPSLKLHTWADTDAAPVSLQILSSQGI